MKSVREFPGSQIRGADIDMVGLESFIEEGHVLVEVDVAIAFDKILDIKMVAWLIEEG